MNDGGPAFPTDHYRQDGESICWSGMTLREWYAGQALAGLLGARKDIGWGLPHDIAKRAFEFADAMITEGEK